jgi:N6-adenosine-specific RNA methylase IME4
MKQGWFPKPTLPLLNVSRSNVQRAKQVIDLGAEELATAVEHGAISVSVAADVTSLSKTEQAEIVARGEKEIIKAAKEIRARKANERRAGRLAKLTTISEGSAELPSDRQFPLLYVDPPWPYHVYDGEIGTQYGAADNHYPVMSLADICKLPVANIATPTAILFMWATSSHLAVAMQVLTAWEFEYVTNIAWVKQNARLGYWVRNQHELLLIARRGDMPTPVPANKSPSVIQAPRREHSRKPDEAYELIERMYPDLPKIELFARQARDGWYRWGNQAPVMAELAEAA